MKNAVTIRLYQWECPPGPKSRRMHGLTIVRRKCQWTYNGANLLQSGLVWLVVVSLHSSRCFEYFAPTLHVSEALRFLLHDIAEHAPRLPPETHVTARLLLNVYQLPRGGQLTFPSLCDGLSWLPSSAYYYASGDPRK